MRVVLVILLITIAQGCAWNTGIVCDYDQAQSITIHMWEKVVAPLPYECYAFLDTYPIVNVGIPCDDPKLNGCVHHHDTQPFRRRIEIEKSRNSAARACTVSHETIHVLGRCIGNSDHDHKNVLYWEKYGNETVEAMSCKEIREQCLSYGL